MKFLNFYAVVCGLFSKEATRLDWHDFDKITLFSFMLTIDSDYDIQTWILTCRSIWLFFFCLPTQHNFEAWSGNQKKGFEKVDLKVDSEVKNGDY